MGEPAFLSEEVTLPTVDWLLLMLRIACFLKNYILRFWLLKKSYPQFQSNPEPDLEVVVCSGYGKNGALSVLQVNPQTRVMYCFNARAPG